MEPLFPEAGTEHLDELCIRSRPRDESPIIYLKRQQPLQVVEYIRKYTIGQEIFQVRNILRLCAVVETSLLRPYLFLQLLSRLSRT